MDCVLLLDTFPGLGLEENVRTVTLVLFAELVQYAFYKFLPDRKQQTDQISG